ncbi:MAG: ArsR/SmtB family transcription factor [Halanaerobiales bacterium]
MLCRKCIILLAKTLSNRSRLIFNTIAENGKLYKTEIEKLTKISYALTSKSLLELKYKQLIKSKQEGRKIIYYLSDEGYELSEISKEVGKC